MNDIINTKNLQMVVGAMLVYAALAPVAETVGRIIAFGLLKLLGLM